MIAYSGEEREKAGGILEGVLSQRTFFGHSFDFRVHTNVLHIQKDKIKLTIMEGILEVNINNNKLT